MEVLQWEVVSLAEFWMVSGIQYRETIGENRLETEQYLQMHQSGMSWGPGLDLNSLSIGYGGRIVQDSNLLVTQRGLCISW